MGCVVTELSEGQVFSVYFSFLLSAPFYQQEVLTVTLAYVCVKFMITN